MSTAQLAAVSYLARYTGRNQNPASCTDRAQAERDQLPACTDAINAVAELAMDGRRARAGKAG